MAAVPVLERGQKGLGAKPRRYRRVTKSSIVAEWKWELISVVVGILVMSAVFTVLRAFDGKEQPNWPLQINLNSIIAVLTIVWRAMIAVILGEVLSQLKFHWFEGTPRPLRDLDLYDAATRGPWGSFRLFFVIARPNLAFLCAFLFLVSYAVEPFNQQAIQSTTCSRYDVRFGSVPAAHYLDLEYGLYSAIGRPKWLVDFASKGAIIRGISDPTSIVTEIKADCPTGNCTFDPLFNTPDGSAVSYSSVGFCSRCINTTTLIQYTPEGTKPFETERGPNVTLPSGLIVGKSIFGLPHLNISTSGNLEWARDLWDPDFAALVPSAYLNVSVLTWTRAPDHENVIGASCVLYPCLRDYNIAVQGGITTEQVVATTPMHRGDATERDGRLTGFLVKTPCGMNHQVYTAENITSASQDDPAASVVVPSQSPTLAGQRVPKECFYKLGPGYSSGWADFVTELLEGACSGDEANAKIHYDCKGSFWLESFINSNAATFETISSVVDNVAVASTNRARNIGKPADAMMSETAGYNETLYEDSEPGRVLGQSTRTSVCVVVDYRWLILPTAIFVISTAILLSIVTQDILTRHSGVPVWKSSILPLLFYGLVDNRPDEVGGRPMRLREIEAEADRMKVVLQHHDEKKAGFVTDSTNVTGPTDGAGWKRIHDESIEVTSPGRELLRPHHSSHSGTRDDASSTDTQTWI